MSKALPDYKQGLDLVDPHRGFGTRRGNAAGRGSLVREVETEHLQRTKFHSNGVRFAFRSLDMISGDM